VSRVTDVGLPGQGKIEGLENKRKCFEASQCGDRGEDSDHRVIRVGCNPSGMRHITKVKPVKFDEVSSRQKYLW
jgi:hypothetical protein